MGSRPGWRAPLRHGNPRPVQSPAFLAAREKFRGTGRKCDKCKRFALRGASLCKRHGGLLAAAAAEAERYGKPVVILRVGKRRASIFRLGLAGPPPGMPLPAYYHDLRGMQKGMLIEAWMNREINPDAWKAALEAGCNLRWANYNLTTSKNPKILQLTVPPTT